MRYILTQCVKFYEANKISAMVGNNGDYYTLESVVRGGLSKECTIKLKLKSEKGTARGMGRGASTKREQV